MIALLVMTDGRRACLERSIPAALRAFDRPDFLSELWIHDDSGDPEFAAWLERRFAPLGFRIISTPVRSGFGGAIRSAWAHLRQHSKARYIFHLEDDFVIDRVLNLSAMTQLLDLRPWLAQLALRRQPWNESERAAGGIVEEHPDSYHERALYLGAGDFLVVWLEHRRFFTTNPSLYRRTLIDDHDWPEGLNSEGAFGIELFGDPDVVAGYWGSRESGEWCEHIGHERVGTGY